MNRTSGIPVARAPRSVRDVNPYMCTMKPLREGGPYHGQLVVEPGVRGCCRCCCKKDTNDMEADKARRKWEDSRRRNFINKCCDGLLATPCCSVGSYSEIMNEAREPAEFFVQCDCSKGKDKKKKLTKRNPKRTVVPKQERENRSRKPSLCHCCDGHFSSHMAPRQVDSYPIPCCYHGDAVAPQQNGYEDPVPSRNQTSDLSSLVDQLKYLVKELRAQRKYSERGFSDYHCMH